MREALDPEQDGGSPIALPPDPVLAADLAAPRWRLGLRGIEIESKDDIRDRIGRSPDRGDAVVMCLAEGQQARRRSLLHGGMPRFPKINLGYSHLKRYVR